MPMRTNKKNLGLLAATFATGLKKHFTNGAQSLAFPGGSVTATVDEAVTSCATIVANRAAVTTAKANARAAVATEDAALIPLLTFIRGLEGFIRYTFEANPAALADFGLAPRKAPTPLTAAQQAAAAAKREATRKARGTKGSKQKKAIKGNVNVAVVVTPQGATAAAPATVPAAAEAPVVAPTAVTPPKA